MNILVIDIGGTHVKFLATGQDPFRQFDSGPTLTPDLMVSRVLKMSEDWTYEAVSLGYPGPVLRGRPVSEPHNLGAGWVGFNFEAVFKLPVKVVNDAAMQALGSFNGGKMLFLGLGTGLGSAMIIDGLVEPMELGHLPYKDATFEDYVGVRGLELHGKAKWQEHVADVVTRLVAALEPEEVVLGGGNIHKLDKLPDGCRAGDNANAFRGGFRLWEDLHANSSVSLPVVKLGLSLLLLLGTVAAAPAALGVRPVAELRAPPPTRVLDVGAREHGPSSCRRQSSVASGPSCRARQDVDASRLRENHPTGDPKGSEL